MSVQAYKIIRYPLVTEKGTDLAALDQYLFRVAPDATKRQIKEAVETIYRVTVERVNVCNVPRRSRMFRGGRKGYRAGYRKAIVTLKKGDKIALA